MLCGCQLLQGNCHLRTFQRFNLPFQELDGLKNKIKCSSWGATPHFHFDF